MVQADLNLKNLVGLKEISAIDEQRFKELLDKFSKKEMMDHIIESLIEEPIEESPNEDVGL